MPLENKLNHVYFLNCRSKETQKTKEKNSFLPGRRKQNPDSKKSKMILLEAFFLSLAWCSTHPKGPPYFLVHPNLPTEGQNTSALLADAQSYIYRHGNSSLLAKEKWKLADGNPQCCWFSLCSPDTDRSAGGILSPR